MTSEIPGIVECAWLLLGTLPHEHSWRVEGDGEYEPFRNRCEDCGEWEPYPWTGTNPEGRNE